MKLQLWTSRPYISFCIVISQSLRIENKQFYLPSHLEVRYCSSFFFSFKVVAHVRGLLVSGSVFVVKVKMVLIKYCSEAKEKLLCRCFVVHQFSSVVNGLYSV